MGINLETEKNFIKCGKLHFRFIQKQLLKQKSSIEEDVEKNEDEKELTEEQQTELQLENGEMQARFSRAWIPPVHTVVLDFSVISYVDTVAVKVLSQVLAKNI